jgi:hypothetical protein
MPYVLHTSTQKRNIYKTTNMKRWKNTCIALVIAFVGINTFTACDRDEEENDVTVNAIVKNLGAVPADGCDWALEIGSTTYHPSTLDPAFKVDGLKVLIRYRPTAERFSCGWGASLSTIELKSIKKQ